MECCSIDCGKIPATVHVSRFRGAAGVDEYHLTIRPLDYAHIETQLDWINQAYQFAAESLALKPETAVFRRFFCSDLINQARALDALPFSNRRNAEQPCAISWIGQPPIPPAKVAMWAYHVADPNKPLDKTLADSSLILRRGTLSHHWTTGVVSGAGATSLEQTRDIFMQYGEFLASRQMTLADNVIRTWLFVQDIDANYQGLVVGRREYFTKYGLTPDTHFIASTGIEGVYSDVAAKVAMDVYSVAGMRPGQIEFLAAPDHLSPTYVYGLTFERGVSVGYRDRKHVIISGTASIDHEGKILHEGDVSRQLDRTLENVGALLAAAGATLNDMCVLIVYVRDEADHAFAMERMRQRFGDAPIQVVVAPVCRPGWLIEVEGMAIVASENKELPSF
jgi:enamine deaminase RidA (YjgF/YER057c/UK114 family)